MKILQMFLSSTSNTKLLYKELFLDEEMAIKGQGVKDMEKGQEVVARNGAYVTDLVEGVIGESNVLKEAKLKMNDLEKRFETGTETGDDIWEAQYAIDNAEKSGEDISALRKKVDLLTAPSLRIEAELMTNRLEEEIEKGTVKSGHIWAADYAIANVKKTGKNVFSLQKRLDAMKKKLGA